jgi:hypothetical protein
VSFSILFGSVGLDSDLASLIVYAIVLLYTTSEIFFAASPAKAIFGTTIRDASGAPASRTQLVLRWAIKFSPLLVGGLSGIVGLIASTLSAANPIFTPSHLDDVIRAIGLTAIGCFAIVAAGVLFALGPSRQTLHDRMTGTAVFERALLPTSASLGPPGFEVQAVPALPITAAPPANPSTAPAEAQSE